MTVEVDVKKKIPDENETKAMILAQAQLVGCMEEAKAIIKKHEEYIRKETNPIVGKKIVINMIKELFYLDARLVGWLFNDNGEIVVMDEIAIKIDPKLIVRKPSIKLD